MALTAPSKDVFDPAKSYRGIRWIGDRDFQDFEGNELQQILSAERKQLFDRVFVDGAIIMEAGGTVAPATQGVATGHVAGASGGTYRGFVTQIYTLRVVTGGVAGQAVIEVTSDGEDSGLNNQGFEILTSASDPVDGSVAYAVGTHGITISFTDTKPIKNFVVTDSWVILATYSRRLPTLDVIASQITPTKILFYADGRAIAVPSTTLTYALATTGKSVVYVEVLKDVVTGDADPDIKAALTNLNVAERERIVGRFVNRDTSGDALPSAAIWRKVYAAYLWDRATDKVERATRRPIEFHLEDIPGQLPAASLADLDFSEQLKGTIAEVVNDITGGSYRIRGLQARISTNAAPSGKVFITVEKGKARISGLKITKTAEEDLSVDLALDTSAVSGEAKTYNTGTDVYALNKAIGANKLPIESVVSVAAIVEVTRQITKGIANGLDELPDQPVQSIVSIAGYTVTTDFVQNGNFVDWSPGGSEPGSGSSYNVTYRYTKQMVEGVDFDLIDDDSDGDLDSIYFSLGGDNPVDTSTFFVDYEYFQPRIDNIILRTDGVFEVLRGVPSDNPIEPKSPSEFLGIARIAIGANSATNIVITQDDNLQVTMAAVRNSIKRQEDQRRNDALQDLINQVKLGETGSFKGVFADAFASEEMSDLLFNRIGGLGGDLPGTAIPYSSLIDLFDLQLLQPVFITTNALVRDDGLIPSGNSACAVNRDFLTLPFSEVLEIDQEQWSEQRNINPFATFTPPPPALTLIPDKDGGVDETTSTQNDIWLVYNGRNIFRAASENEVNLWFSTHPRYQATGRSSQEISRILEERAGTYMRQINVEVRGTKFVPGEDNIQARFDGKAVNLTAINGTPTGTLGGSLKARLSTFDINNEVVTRGGDFEGTFSIPQNVPTGIRTLVLTGASGSRAEGSYDGRFTERAITIFEREYVVIADPVAQSFGFSQPTTITRVRIPFAGKGAAGDSPVTVQLRTVELPGGFPGRSYFDEVVRKPQDIIVGAPNQFVFGNPIYQPANTLRALVLLSDSNNYLIYTATLGRAGLNPTQHITQNPNIRGTEPAGILLESLNAVNWEAESRSALRYQVYRAEFSAEAWVYFTRLTGVNYSQLVLNADTVIPSGTAIEWNVSTDGLAVGNSLKTWRTINPYEKLDLESLATTIDIRAKLITTNTRVSPYIATRTVSLQGIRYTGVGRYVSRRADVTQDIATVKYYLEIKKPAVVTVAYYVSNAEDANGDPIWEVVSVVDSDVDLGDGFHLLTLSKTLNNAIVEKTSYRKLRVRVDQVCANHAFSAAIRNLAATFN